MASMPVLKGCMLVRTILDVNLVAFVVILASVAILASVVIQGVLAVLHILKVAFLVDSFDSHKRVVVHAVEEVVVRTLPFLKLCHSSLILCSF